MTGKKKRLDKFRLTINQKKVLVEIAVELGVIGIAAVALPAIFDRGSFMVVILGVTFSLASWYSAVRLAGRL